MAQLKDTVVRGNLEADSLTIGGNISHSGQSITHEYNGDQVIENLKRSDFDSRMGVVPTERQYLASTYIKDKNDEDVAWDQTYLHTSGKLWNSIGIGRCDSNGENRVSNSMMLGIDADGNKEVMLSDPDVWRTEIGAAAASHNHSASNITSGTLPVSRGGTGRTATVSGAMYATSSGGDIKMGKLPIAQGGTGSTTAADARSALGAAAKNWTSIGSVKSNEKINITNKLTGYNEIMVIIGYGSTYWSSCVLRASAVTSTLREWYTGGGCDHALTWNAGAGFYLSTTQFGAMYVYLGSGSAKTATAYLYAR